MSRCSSDLVTAFKSFYNYQGNIWVRQESSMDITCGKLVGFWWGGEYMHRLKKGRKEGRKSNSRAIEEFINVSIRWLKLKSHVRDRWTLCAFRCKTLRKKQHCLCIVLAEDTKSESNQKDVPDTHRMRKTLYIKNVWEQGCIKTLVSWNTSKGCWKYSRWEKAKKACLTVLCNTWP